MKYTYDLYNFFDAYNFCNRRVHILNGRTQIHIILNTIQDYSFEMYSLDVIVMDHFLVLKAYEKMGIEILAKYANTRYRYIPLI